MVSTTTIIVSIILFLLSLWLALWLVGAMLSPFFSVFRARPSGSSSSPRSGRSLSLSSLFPSKGFAERWSFRRCVRALNEIERGLQKDQKIKNKKLFLRALFLEWIRGDFDLIGKSAHHHMDLLNKLIILAEVEGGSVQNLPKLEQLFAKRTEILKGAFDAAIAKKRFSEKQRTKGKTPPSWSTKEFDSKLKSLESEMKELRKDIIKEMKAALSSIHEGRSSIPDDKHYH